jgi:quercetin dioxygenase-like cupin family protein
MVKCFGREWIRKGTAATMPLKLSVCLCLLIVATFWCRETMWGDTKTSPTEGRVLANPAEVKWDNSKNGSESTTLREDSKTGSLELLARYPAGHVFPPHWHNANERIVLIEGRIAIEDSAEKHFIEPGGYAYLPARQVQKLTCVSSTRCSFYVFWDGAPASHPAAQ